MASDNGSDAVNLYRAVQLWKTFFNQVSNGFRIFVTGGMGDITFSVIIKAVSCIFLHSGNDFFDYLTFCADLLLDNQLAFAVDVHQRADI